MNIDVSIIIVNYNTKNLLKNCLASVYEKTTEINFEIFVVDNNSTDGSCEMLEETFPNVKLIKNDKNLGFGAANNIAIKQSNAKYVFLLNSDTILLNNSIKIFFDFMENKNNQQIACCGGNLYDKDLNYNCSYNFFPSIKEVFFKRLYLDKFFKKYYREKIVPGFYIESNSINEVDYVTGADMFIRKTVLNEIKGFDEDFYLYYEDSEMCSRMHKNGYKLVIIPDAKIIHLAGASSKKNEKILKIAKQSELLFFEKCYGKNQRKVISAIQILGEIPRLFVKGAKDIGIIK